MILETNFKKTSEFNKTNKKNLKIKHIQKLILWNIYEIKIL